MSTSTQYKSGDLVLTKIKGFPEWPTRVVDFSLLPEHIQNLKPKTVSSKSTSRSRSRRRNGKGSRDHGESICVKFYGDDEYTWCSTNDLKPLSEEQVADYLVKKGEIPDKTGNYVAKKTAKGKKLTEAYKLAYNKELSADDFIKYGSEGKPAKPEAEEIEEQEEEIEEPAKKPEATEKKISKNKSRSPASNSKNSTKPNGKSSSRANAKRKAVSSSAGSRKKVKSSPTVALASSRTRARSSTPKSRSSSKPKPKATPKVESSSESQSEESEESDDWGEDIVNVDSGIVDVKTIPSSVVLSKESNNAKKVYSKLRAKIQAIVLGPLDEGREKSKVGKEKEDGKKDDEEKDDEEEDNGEKDDGEEEDGEKDDGEKNDKENAKPKIDYKQKISLLNPLVDEAVNYNPPLISALRSTNLYRVLIIILKKPEYQNARFSKKLRKFMKETWMLKFPWISTGEILGLRKWMIRKRKNIEKSRQKRKLKENVRAEARKEAKSREESVAVEEAE
ncbi:DEBR0S1_07910g1_1 [Brettanomyces bruxellensis]|uniref:DEBR0S1_07910g1_1 n=1 Tax=Dekkera bruxellensis TaxID=5007 RepID=A0A7D9GZI7_DEKBR|nr:DEBR0S1_07910g1_1 [Brettanomyces bruxellensis]